MVFSGSSGFLHQLNRPYDITEISLKVALDTINQIRPSTRELLLIIQFEEMLKTIFVVKYEIVFIYYYPSTHIL